MAMCVLCKHLCAELRVLWARERWSFTSSCYHTVATALDSESALGPVAGQRDRLKITAEIELMRLVIEGG